MELIDFVLESGLANPGQDPSINGHQTFEECVI